MTIYFSKNIDNLREYCFCGILTIHISINFRRYFVRIITNYKGKSELHREKELIIG